MTETILWVIAIALILIGAVIWRRGMRSRRRRDPKNSRRERHLLSIALGMLMVVAGLEFLAVAGWDFLQSHKPLWWVRRETESSDPQERIHAINTLTNRLNDRELDPADTKRFLQYALQLQLDRLRPWEPAWGNFIEAGRKAKHVSDEQWRAYVQTAIDWEPTLKVRPRVRRTAPLPINLQAVPARCGDGNAGESIIFNYRLIRVGVDGITWEPPADKIEHSSVLSPRESTPSTFVLDLPKAVSDRLTPGEHQLQLEIERLVYEHTEGGDWPGREIERRSFPLTGKFQAVEPDRPTVELIVPPDLAPQIRKSLSLFVCGGGPMAPASPAASSAGPATSKPSPADPFDSSPFEISIRAEDLPIGLACEVAVRLDGREQAAEPITIVRPYWALSLVPNPSSRPRIFELILTPSVSVAERTVELSQIWGQPIILKWDGSGDNGKTSIITDSISRPTRNTSATTRAASPEIPR